MARKTKAISHGILELDRVFSMGIYRFFHIAWKQPFRFPFRFLLISLLKLLTLSIDGTTWFPLVPIFLMTFSNPKTHFFTISLHRMLLELYIGSLFLVVVELFLKSLFKRKRPALKSNSHPRFIHAENFSFPSGHTLRAFYIAASISNNFLPLLSNHGPTRHIFQSRFGSIFSLPLTLFLWSSGVALSRVAVGRHFVLDVAGGAAVGLLCEFLNRSTELIPAVLNVFM